MKQPRGSLAPGQGEWRGGRGSGKGPHSFPREAQVTGQCCWPGARQGQILTRELAKQLLPNMKEEVWGSRGKRVSSTQRIGGNAQGAGRGRALLDRGTLVTVWSAARWRGRKGRPGGGTCSYWPHVALLWALSPAVPRTAAAATTPCRAHLCARATPTRRHRRMWVHFSGRGWACWLRGSPARATPAAPDLPSRH